MKRMFPTLVAIVVLLLTYCTPKTSTTITDQQRQQVDEAVKHVTATAQSVEYLNTELGVSDNVRIGKLDNGLTYYIRKNSKPENKVELRLAVNAGSINESDEQLGLAHFTEHMLFNGTKHFKSNELVDYLQGVGVKFGAHLNAYTSFDETVYMLSLPIENPAVLDTGMLVLQDWANGAILADDEIDKERGVVLEEYRLGLGADKRMMNRYLPKVFYESRYADRLPIGKKEILEGFDYETLKSFYHDWYRPNLMAVAIVGDIDPDDIEMKIKEGFGSMTNPSDAPTREVYKVPNHVQTLVSVETDPEAPYGIVRLMHKDIKDAEVNKTYGDYREMVKRNLFSLMVNGRLAEKLNSAEPPFIFSSVYYGSTWARTKRGYQSFAVVGPGGHMNAARTLLEEDQRVKQHGFIPTEFERAKSSMLTQYEQSYNERDKTESAGLIGEYVRNFLEAEPIPGIEWEYNFVKEILPTITLDEVQALTDQFLQPGNRVVIFTGPEPAVGTNSPTEQEVLSLINEIEKMDIEPYTEEVVGTSLVTEMPPAGKITATGTNDMTGIIDLELSNGARVTYKKTDFKNDEVLFKAMSAGGTNTISDEDYKEIAYGMDAISDGGINGFDQNALEKFLQGKNVALSSYVSSISEGMNGSFAPKDIETFFEMLYANFTGLDYNESAYNSYMSRQIQLYSSLAADPVNAFYKEYSEYVDGHDPRFTSWPTEEAFSQTNFRKAYERYKARFANAADFHFYFVGNIDEETFIPLVERYIASLPSDQTYKENVIDRGVRSNSDNLTDLTVNKGQEPKSMVRITYDGETTFSTKDDFLLEATADILDIKLIEILREEKGGVYGVGAFGGVNKYPYGNYYFGISFPCGPENAADLTEAALAEVKKIVDNGPEQKDVDKVREAMLTGYDEDIKTNEAWLSSISTSDFQELDRNRILDTKQLIRDNLTAANIQATAKKFLSGKPLISTLMPEK